MKSSPNFLTRNILSWVRSLHEAIKGLRSLILNDQQSTLHICLILLLLAGSFFVGLPTFKWTILVLAGTIIISLDLIRLAVEYLFDFVSPRWEEHIKVIRELLTAAQWCAALAMITISIILFIPFN
ncbi:MAG: diacylglycerol kinase [Cyclobacteriaceae bacterium]|nr:diacylglycerol kinase [Cyclobacteriaceae bacterium HetDA_MAG_MS6]